MKKIKFNKPNIDFKNPKTLLIIGIAIILIIVTVYIIGKRAGKSDYPDFYVPPDAPDGGIYVDNNFVQNIVAKMYSELKGYALITTYYYSTWSDYATCSDSNFVAAYNLFNDKYYNDQSRTLIEWIKHDRNQLGNYIWAVNMSNVKRAMDQIITRANNLNMP
jgi:hypothetical protein